jgi:hypothetical protein
MREATISQVNDSVPDRLDRGLGAISNAEFLEEGLGMGLHAFLANLKFMGNFLVAATRDNQAQDIQFPRRKILPQLSLPEARGNIRGHHGSTSMDRLDRTDQLSAG